MGAAAAQVREWGSSLGIVIPKDIVQQDNLSNGDTVFIVVRKTNALKDFFGKVKLKRSTDEILREIDEEGWNA